MTDTHRRRSLPYPVRLVLVLAAVVAAGVLWNRVTNQPSSERAASPAATSAPAAPAAAPAAAGEIRDGVWIVGADVQPGTYRSTGALDGDYCMWSRHSSAGGGPMDDIIASDGSYNGQMLVTIAASDKVFRTHGCAPFQPV